jgi:hypothetical protein
VMGFAAMGISSDALAENARSGITNAHNKAEKATRRLGSLIRPIVPHGSLTLPEFFESVTRFSLGKSLTDDRRRMARLCTSIQKALAANQNGNRIKRCSVRMQS